MTGPDQEIADAIEAHAREFFAPRVVEGVRVLPRTLTRLPGLRVLRVAPGTGETWTFVSVGAWVVEPEGGARLEFVVTAPDAGERSSELLQMAAYYHANDDRTFRLGLGHTVPIGEPWLPGSACTHLLVSKPYPFGPALEVFDGHGVHVHFSWLLPITDAERAFKQAHGLEALERRFDEARLEYWRPDRPSVVAGV